MSRKKIIAVFAAVLLCGSMFMANAEMKFGYVNVENVFNSFQGTKDAKAKLQKEVAKWEQEATNRNKEIMDLKEQLEKQSLLLSNERKNDIIAKVKQKSSEYEDFLKAKFGQDGEITAKNAELTKPILDRINKIIEKIAKDDNYDFVFDSRTVMYGKPIYDLTDRVLTSLNKEK